MKTNSLRALLILSLLLCVAPTAHAAITMVLHVAGITGESTVTNHVGDIDISSFTTGITVPVNSFGTPGAPSFADISIVKNTDKSSPPLTLSAATGGVLSEVTIYCIKNTGGGAKPLEFYVIDLKNVLISGISASSSGATPTETLTLHFEIITWTYTPANSDGTPGTPITVGYNILTRSKI